MATPNQMPKRPNHLKQQVISGLIADQPADWNRKRLVKDGDGKESVETVTVKRTALRNPLAQNVSEQNVEALAKRWI